MEGMFRSPSPHGRVGTSSLHNESTANFLSPSPHGRVGTFGRGRIHFCQPSSRRPLMVGSELANRLSLRVGTRGVAVPSWSGRNDTRRVGSPESLCRSPSPHGRVGTTPHEIRLMTPEGSPSPHGRVGTAHFSSPKMFGNGVAVPSWSGRNAFLQSLNLKFLHCRRPLMVGSEPSPQHCWRVLYS